MPDYTSGFGGAMDAMNVQAYRNQQIEQMRQAQMRAAVQQAMAQQALQRLLSDQESAGGGLRGMFGPPPQIAPPQAAQGTPANPMPPGVGEASVPMQRTPQAQPAAPAQPLSAEPDPPYQNIPRFRGDPAQVQAEIVRMPDPRDRQAAMAQFQAEGSTEITTPPAQAAAPTAPASRPESHAMSAIKSFVQSQVARGVPDGELTRSLALVFPALNAEGQQALKAAAQENNLLKIELQAAQARALLPIQQKKADAASTAAGAADKRADTAANQGQQRIDLMSRKVDAAIAEAAATRPEELTPEGMALAEELVRAGKPLPGGWGKTGISRGNAILNRIASGQEGGAGSGSIVAGQAGYKAASSGLAQITKDLAAIRPYKEMLDLNGNIAIDLAGKAIATDSKFANRGVNWLRQNASDNPDVAEFLAQARIVSTEAARVLNNPRLVGQLTDTARKEMESVISGDMPLNSFVRVIKRMQADGKNRVSTMEKERARLTGDSGAAGAASTINRVPTADVVGRRAGDKIAVNPATGEKLILRNGQWQPMTQ